MKMSSLKSLAKLLLLSAWYMCLQPGFAEILQLTLIQFTLLILICFLEVLLSPLSSLIPRILCMWSLLCLCFLQTQYVFNSEYLCV